MLDKNDPRLTAFVLDELSDSEKAEIQKAVNDSPELQRAIEDIKSTVSLIETEFANQPAVELGSQQHEAINRAIEGAPQKPVAPAQTSENRPSLRPANNIRWGWVLAIAAALLLVVTPLAWNQFFDSGPLDVMSSLMRRHEEEPANSSRLDSSSDKKELGDDTVNEKMLRDQSQQRSPDLMPDEPVDQASPRFFDSESDQQKPGNSPSRFQQPDRSQRQTQNRVGDGSELGSATGALEGDEGKFEFSGQTGDFGGEGREGLGSLNQRTRRSLEMENDPEIISGYKGDASGGQRGGFGNPQSNPIGDFASKDDDKSAETDGADGKGLNGKVDDSRLSDSRSPDGLAANSISPEDDDSNSTSDLPAATKPNTATAGDLDEWVQKVEVASNVAGKRKETRSRIVQTEEGPKTEIYEVEVPFSENQSETRYRLSDIKAKEIAQKLAKRIDPTGTRQIILPPVPEVLDELDLTILAGAPEDVEKTKALVEELKELNKATDRLRSDDGEIIKVDREMFWKQVQGQLEKRNKQLAEKQTWKRVRATANASRLMIGDKDELPMSGMQVNVQVEGFRARVLIDCFYYNDRNRQHEGNFKIRLPDDSSLYYFAFGQSVYEYTPQGKLSQNEFLSDGQQFVSLRSNEVRRLRQDSWQNVKESKMVPREQAAFAYSQTVRRRVDPALVEWTGGGIFNARVFPLMPRKMHRIVIGYDVDLTPTDDGLAYQLDLPEQTGECLVNVNVSQEEGTDYQISPTKDPTESDGLAISPQQRREIDRMETQLDQDIRRLGKSHPQVTELANKIQKTRMELVAQGNDDRTWLNFRFDNPEQKTIRLTTANSGNTILQSDNGDQPNFFATRFKVDMPAKANEQGNSRAIFLVDTSLSSQPDKFNVWLKMLQATLNNNREQLKEFGVVFFNVESKFWREEYTTNTSENVKALVDDCNQLGLEGATDLYGAVQRVTMADWVKEGSSPNIFLLSDGNVNWGETNLRLIHRLFDQSNLGSLFAYQTGMTGTAVSALRFLSGETGGAVFSVANENEIANASTAHRSQPWQVNKITASNGRDLLTAGRVQWVYPGQMVTLVGRCDDSADIGQIKMSLSQGDREIELEINTSGQMKSELAGRLFGQVAVGQLESLGQQVFDVSAAYARHFRITGQTCSLLMLESEADYKRFNIVPQDDLIVVNSREVSKLVADVLNRSAAEIADPKSQLLTWVRRLESMEGMQFKIPTALSLAMDEIQVQPIASQLNCKLRKASEIPEDFRKMLVSGRLDYASISAESKRRMATSTDDAIKAISSLVENNPGDVVIARDVAFTAMELQHPAQAYHLLRRVAESRPYEATIYTAIGKCLSQLGQADMAIVFYEIALNAKFQDRGEDFRRITAAEYSYLLRRIKSGQAETSVKDYASARLQSLNKKFNLQAADVLVTMMWNTDQTDVDLHVLEPSGEECSYQHTTTRSGGHITRDITTGFGPEMYTLPRAPKGKYSIAAKYFSTDTNRTGLRGKVYITIYHDFGSDTESVNRRTVEVSDVGQKQTVDTFSVK